MVYYTGENAEDTGDDPGGKRNFRSPCVRPSLQ